MEHGYHERPTGTIHSHFSLLLVWTSSSSFSSSSNVPPRSSRFAMNRSFPLLSLSIPFLSLFSSPNDIRFLFLRVFSSGTIEFKVDRSKVIFSKLIASAGPRSTIHRSSLPFHPWNSVVRSAVPAGFLRGQVAHRFLSSVLIHPRFYIFYLFSANFFFGGGVRIPRFINSRQEQSRRKSESWKGGGRVNEKQTDGNWFQTGSETGRERLNWNFSRSVWIKKGILRSYGKYSWRKGLGPRCSTIDTTLSLFRFRPR